MQIQSAKQGEQTIVTLTGRLDVTSAPLLDQHCQQIVDQGARTLVLDLSQLEYLGSAGLRSILAVGRVLNSLSGKVIICSPKGIVKDVLVMSGFSGMFPMIDSLEQAK